MTTYSFFKKYALFALVLGLFSLFLVLVVKSRISDNSVSRETERAYKVPQRIGISSDQHRAKVPLTHAPSTQHEAQGRSSPPPEKEPNLEKQERLKARLKAIEAQFEEREGQVIRNPVEILKMLKLEEEMQRIGKELGALDTGNRDPFLGSKIGQLVLPNLTDDNRLPVSVGEELVDLLVESSDIDGAATVYMATQRAMENGDEFFTPGHWTEQGTSDQAFSEDSDVTTDPCCPDEPTPVHLEDRHVHSMPTSPPTPPQAAKSVKAEPSEELSLERFRKGQQLIGQYGTEEGLRRLQESDPEAARQFERERRPVPSRDVPDGRQSESGSKD